MYRAPNSFVLEVVKLRNQRDFLAKKYLMRKPHEPQNVCRAGYRWLARQPRTCLVVVSQEKITLYENYLHMFHSSCYFLIKYFFVRKSFWFCNFTVNSAKRFEARATKNLSREMTTATWINLYTRFISHRFLCCKLVLRTSHESSGASLGNSYAV